MSLNDLLDEIARSAYGWTRAEAQALGLCIACRRVYTDHTHTSAGAREYKISALCEECFDNISKES